MKIKRQPAKTYDLNILASVISKFQVENLSKKTLVDLNKVITYSIKEIGPVKKPFVPHNDPMLLSETKKFIDKLLNMVSKKIVKSKISKITHNKLIKVLNDFKRKIDSLKKQRHKFFVSKKEIATMFYFNEMWDIGMKEVEDENKIRMHANNPTIPENLKIKANQVETADLIQIVNDEVFNFKKGLKVNSRIIENDSEYHLFWNITQSGIDYVTPGFYGMHNQLSFDLPHNVSHLAHLRLLKKEGVTVYIDDMATRAFFEAIAVFSEYEMLVKLRNNKEVVKQISKKFIKKRRVSQSDLLKWMIQDREYQLKLRNVRLLSDILTVQGYGFEEVVKKVTEYFKIPEEIARGEVLKYYPWTGLGAVYTLGYRKLKNYGITELNQVLKRNPPRTWNDFLKKF